MSGTAVNGRVRKSLAEQIDRLDSILDGLAENLNEAVASAVQQAVGVAVREALRGVLTEVLSNSDVLVQLRGLLTGPVPGPRSTVVPEPSTTRVLRTARSWLGTGWSWLRCLGAAVSGRCAAAARQVRSWWRLLQLWRRPLSAALLVGMAAGVGAYCAGPWLAALASGAGGFALTLTVQTWLWLRRVVTSGVAEFD